MSSYCYPPQSRQPGTYSPQQLAQMQAQPQQRLRQPSHPVQQTAHPASSYPSPDSSTSSGSPASSPESHHHQHHPLPTLSRPGPSQYTTQQPPPPPLTSTSSRQKDPPYLCLYPSHAGTAFARKADLKRHYDHVHRPPTAAAAARRLDCPQPGCHRRGELGFGRKDKLVEHLREVHAWDIPKRVAGGRGREGEGEGERR